MSYASEKRRLELKHQAAEASARLDAARQRVETKHPKDWAYRLRDRERAGEKLTEPLRKMWRQALGED